MATSGSFTGSRGGNSDGPYLRLDWKVTETDIPSNRSKVQLTLVLVATSRVNFSASKSGSLHGSSFTYTGGMSGTGSRTLSSKSVWVGHNSDGSKSQSFSASFNIAISYSGNWVGSLSVSGTANLNTIPRASSLNSFSFGTHLRTGYSNSINLGISRASGSFTHDIQLRDGSTVIAYWNGQGTPSSLGLSASQVNTLLSRMSTQINKSFTLRIQTKNGSTNIGSAVTRNATATVDGNVVPEISSASVNIYGSGRDKSIGKYIQSISRAVAEFSSNASGGASVASRNIRIESTGSGGGSSGGSVVGSVFQYVNGYFGSSGGHRAVFTIKDSRGRTATRTINFTVEAYSTPRISVFNADRNSSVPTTVNIRRAGSHTSLGGSNLLTIKVQKRSGTQAWVDINNATTTGSTSTFDASFTNTGNLVTQSYEFRLYIVDQFGNSAESIITTSTSRVVLDIHKNDGVGIGKIHERGVLDLDGDVFSNGKLFAYGGLEIAGNSWADRGEAFGGLQLNNSDILGVNGIFFNDVSQDNNGEGLMFLKSGKTEGSINRADYDNLLMRDGQFRLNGIAGGDILWEGSVYMNESQTITPSKSIEDCPNGWCLVWSDFDPPSTANNSEWAYTYILKSHWSGGGISIPVPRTLGGSTVTNKYVYVDDKKRLRGHAGNNKDGGEDVCLREVRAW